MAHVAPRPSKTARLAFARPAARRGAQCRAYTPTPARAAGHQRQRPGPLPPPIRSSPRVCPTLPTRGSAVRLDGTAASWAGATLGAVPRRVEITIEMPPRRSPRHVGRLPAPRRVAISSGCSRGPDDPRRITSSSRDTVRLEVYAASGGPRVSARSPPIGPPPRTRSPRSATRCASTATAPIAGLRG